MPEIGKVSDVKSQNGIKDGLEDSIDLPGVDPTIEWCEFCTLQYLTKFPPKRPLSPYIFFS